MKTAILDLLETKNFEKLTSDERAMVLQEMSEKEYRAQRSLIMAANLLASEEKAELEPSPAILIAAQQKLSNRKKAGGALIFQHKIPTWVATAACFLLLLGLWGIKSSGTESTVVTETIHDTIYQEKIITEQVELPGDTIVEYIYINQPEVIYEMVDNTNNYVKEDPDFEHLYFKEDPYCNIMSCYEPKKGMTVADDKWLKLAQDNL